MNAFARSLVLGTAVAFSTINAGAHPTDFLVTSNSQGIVVDRVHKQGVEPVSGSPFVPSPVPGTITPLCLSNPTPQPSLLSLDPEGKYLYAIYETDGCLSIYSFQMLNGVPYVVTPYGYFVGAHGHSGAYGSSLLVGKRFVFVLLQPILELGAPTSIAIFGTRNGVLAFDGVLEVISPSAFGFPASPVSLQTDESEEYLYLTYQGTVGTFGDCTAITCVAILKLGGHAESLTIIATLPVTEGFQITTH